MLLRERRMSGSHFSKVETEEGREPKMYSGTTFEIKGLKAGHALLGGEENVIVESSNPPGDLGSLRKMPESRKSPRRGNKFVITDPEVKDGVIMDQRGSFIYRQTGDAVQQQPKMTSSSSGKQVASDQEGRGIGSQPQDGKPQKGMAENDYVFDFSSAAVVVVAVAAILLYFWFKLYS